MLICTWTWPMTKFSYNIILWIAMGAALFIGGRFLAQASKKTSVRAISTLSCSCLRYKGWDIGVALCVWVDYTKKYLLPSPKSSCCMLSACVAQSFVQNYSPSYIDYSPLQWRYVHYCHPFQTDLLHMVLIWLLILMWVQLLLIPVTMVTVCLDLRLESVYSEGDGIACLLCASVR